MPNPDTALPLAIWGPSASGKTVLMAQLHLQTHRGHSDWNVLPAQQKTLAFIQQMEERRHQHNEFPRATPVGAKEEVAYLFAHHGHIKASLLVEDRAGNDYETMEEDSRRKMNEALGLVLLIDPFRDPGKLYLELSRLLNQMHVDRLRSDGQTPKDPRPIAVCLSKADLLIESAADYHRACATPDAFVRDMDRWNLIPLLDKFCAHYCLFPVSAVGVELRYGIIETSIFYDEELNLRVKTQGQPFNLMEPFTWLIHELAALPAEY